MPTNPIIIGRVDELLSDAEIQMISGQLISEFGRVSFHEHRDPVERLPNEDYFHYFGAYNGGAIVVNVTTPYFNEEYQRGDWEKIKLIFRALIRAIPAARLFYANDSDDTIFEFTDSYVEMVEASVTQKRFHDAQQVSGGNGDLRS